MKNTIKYEAIFVLVNQGFTDHVMDAARANGARGGTILNTRGGVNETAVKNYGMTILSDTELVLIIVESDIKTQVINAIYKAAGIETKARGVIWSMPADNVVGLNKNLIIDKKPAETVEKKPAEKAKPKSKAKK